MREFPPEKLLDKHSPTPELLNAPFRILTQKQNALTEQDFSAAFANVALMAENSVTLYAGSRTSEDPGIQTASNDWPHIQGGATPVEISDSLAWQTVAETTITSGEDELWITGWCVFSVGDEVDGEDGPWPFPSRMQFALEVDSAVIDETITGPENDAAVVPYELYRTDHEFKSYKEWDSRHIERLQDANGINPSVRAVRVTYSVPVMEGPHTVRLVARRALRSYRQQNVPNTPATTKPDYYIRRDDNTTNKDPNKAYIWNRAVYAIRVGGTQGVDTSGAGNSVRVTPYVDQQVVSQTNLNVDRLAYCKDAMNDIKANDVSRGAFQAAHLPSIVDGVELATTASAGTFNTAYVAHEDTTGDVVLATSDAQDFSDGEGIVVIMANVEIVSLLHDPVTGEVPNSHFVCLKLALDDGSLHTLECTEGLFSQDVFHTRSGVDANKRYLGTLDEDMEEDAPLVWIGTPDELPVQVFDSVKILCTVHHTSGTSSDLTATLGRAHISTFRVRR